MMHVMRFQEPLKCQQERVVCKILTSRWQSWDDPMSRLLYRSISHICILHWWTPQKILTMLEERFKRNPTPMDTKKYNASFMHQETKFTKISFRRKCIQHMYNTCARWRFSSKDNGGLRICEYGRKCGLRPSGSSKSFTYSSLILCAYRKRTQKLQKVARHPWIGIVLHH